MDYQSHRQHRGKEATNESSEEQRRDVCHTISLDVNSGLHGCVHLWRRQALIHCGNLVRESLNLHLSIQNVVRQCLVVEALHTYNTTFVTDPGQVGITFVAGTS